MAKKNRSTTLGVNAEAPGDWRAESDMHTLMEAEKIKNDPKRHQAAKDMAKKRLTEVATVAAQQPNPSAGK